jgi:hypothetical protein
MATLPTVSDLDLERLEAAFKLTRQTSMPSLQRYFREREFDAMARAFVPLLIREIRSYRHQHEATASKGVLS